MQETTQTNTQANTQKDKQQTPIQLVPLAAIAWPKLGAFEELNRLYEALVVIISEQVDLLILSDSSKANEVRERLETLSVPSEAIYFFDYNDSGLDIAKRFQLNLKVNDDGTESIDLDEIIAPKEKSLRENSIEHLVVGSIVLVPFYQENEADEPLMHDQLMQLAQDFPTHEVAAINCESLNEFQLKLSDIILFSNI